MKKQNKKILITGGAGYIGQNFISFFLKKRYRIYVIDNFSTSVSLNNNVKKKINFYKIDLSIESEVKSFFKNKNFDLIIHLAAFSGVQEFNKNVLKSFNNNVLATRNLTRFGFNNQKTKLIFSSSAAVYGKVSRKKISETNICNPANYYGLSKLACENIINYELKKKKNNYAILRYFNIVGSIVNFKINKQINSLFDIIGSYLIRKKYKININGNNFNTKDGTPERDFIHIVDLCRIHEKVYKYLKTNKKIILNCGSGTRYSVLEVIRAFEKKLKLRFLISYKLTNPDETQTICANIGQLKKLFKINIKTKDINILIKDYL